MAHVAAVIDQSRHSRVRRRFSTQSVPAPVHEEAVVADQ